MKTTVPAVAFAGLAGCAEAPGPMTRLATIARTPTRASSEVLRMYVLHLSRCSSENASPVRHGADESSLEHSRSRGQPAPSRETNALPQKARSLNRPRHVVAGIASLMTAEGAVC